MATKSTEESHAANLPVKVSPKPDARRSDSAISLAEQGWETFQHDYEKLLQSHCGQWVAYRGDCQIAFSPMRVDLVKECVRRGLREDDCVFVQILPVVEEVAMGMA